MDNGLSVFIELGQICLSLFARSTFLLVQQENAFLTCCKEFQKSSVTLILMK